MLIVNKGLTDSRLLWRSFYDLLSKCSSHRDRALRLLQPEGGLDLLGEVVVGTVIGGNLRRDRTVDTKNWSGKNYEMFDKEMKDRP